MDDIFTYVDGNSSYVQQLSWLVWTRTEDDVDDIFLTPYLFIGSAGTPICSFDTSSIGAA